MIVEKLHLYIALFAGAVMTAVNIFLKAELLEVCTRLIMTLVLFYIVGLAAKVYILKKIVKPPEPSDDEKSQDEDAISVGPIVTDDEGFSTNTAFDDEFQ